MSELHAPPFPYDIQESIIKLMLSYLYLFNRLFTMPCSTHFDKIQNIIATFLQEGDYLVIIRMNPIVYSITTTFLRQPLCFGIQRRTNSSTTITWQHKKRFCPHHISVYTADQIPNNSRSVIFCDENRITFLLILFQR